MINTVPKSDDRRFAERTQLQRPAVLRFDDRSAEVELDDLTRDGCRITTDIELAPDTSVIIGLAGIGQVAARLVWRSTAQYGCAFDSPLPSGAITAAKLNNVAYLDSFERLQPLGAIGNVLTREVAASETKYSYRRRLAIIGGASGLLWGGIIGVVALLV